jgi:YVTN family beta-propeller protein
VGVAIAAAPRTARAAEDAGDVREWGRYTAPVFGTSEHGVYRGAELFAGPNKFANDYFHGVLPNGRIVRPAGVSAQVGMNPLGIALTRDGRYLIISNDDERNGNLASLQNATNHGGYSLSVVDTATMKVVSQVNAVGALFVGLQATGDGPPYTGWVSGGADNTVKTFAISETGVIGTKPCDTIPIEPLLPRDKGYVSHYVPGSDLAETGDGGYKPPVPTNFDAAHGAKITFPAGSALSPDGKFLYVACNGDNSLAVIDTARRTVVNRVPVGFFPYAVAVTPDGRTAYVSNWGVTEYKFKLPTYSPTGLLSGLGMIPGNQPDGFYVPRTVKGKTSSVSVISIPDGDGSRAAPDGWIDQSKALDALSRVGDTHPSAMAVLRNGAEATLCVTRSNDDSLGLVPTAEPESGGTVFDLSPIHLGGAGGEKLVGAYPDAVVAARDGSRAYVAEAGLNDVAVLDTARPGAPRLIGRIPTGWYPTGLALTQPGRQDAVRDQCQGRGRGHQPRDAVPRPQPRDGRRIV